MPRGRGGGRAGGGRRLGSAGAVAPGVGMVAKSRQGERAPPGGGGAGGAGSAGFYGGLLRFLKTTRVPFLVGGTFAVNAYTGQSRETKDLDIFCRPSDYPRLLKLCAEAGYQTEVEDERWIAKVHKGRLYCDVIFGSANAVAPVTDDWFAEEHRTKVHGVTVRMLAPTELVWGKAFIMDRYKYDGNDIAHVILIKHREIDWKRLVHHFDQHWEVLLEHLIRFRFIYPSERDAVPAWVLDLLLERFADLRRLPEAHKRVCRGRLFSRDDFEIDVMEWGFADVVGDHQVDRLSKRMGRK